MLSIYTLLFTLWVAVAPTMAQTEPSKQPKPLQDPITPAFDLDGALETELLSMLPTKFIVSTATWSPTAVPQACKNAATDPKVNLNPADFYVLVVTYEDCADPWVIFKHKNSLDSDKVILEFLSNLVIMPNVPGFAAYEAGGYVVLFGNNVRLGTMAHEFSHVLDEIALAEYLKNGEQEFSSTSWDENFAESSRRALTNMLLIQKGTKDGLISINENASRISHQINTYQNYLQKIIFPEGGRCTGKVASTPAVPVSNSVKVSARDKGLMPNVNLSGEVPEIVIPETALGVKRDHLEA
ncbi:hypothetical protein GQ53DRAFT_770189 [Thozetella sp. PMI_491]|nr:hypothetical protein GQ53DRAFT_770189 [Thozetella sp. PMI_491]